MSRACRGSPAHAAGEGSAHGRRARQYAVEALDMGGAQAVVEAIYPAQISAYRPPHLVLCLHGERDVHVSQPYVPPYIKPKLLLTW